MVSVLTGTGDGVLNAARMPSTDTSDLPETLSGLSGKLGHSPTGGDTFESLTLGNTDDINVLVEVEDILDLDFLLHEPLAELNLLADGATVDLDLHDVSLLLAKVQLADLGVGNDTDVRAVLLDPGELAEEILGLLGDVLLVLGESLLFGAGTSSCRNDGGPQWRGGWPTRWSKHAYRWGSRCIRPYRQQPWGEPQQW